MEPTWGDLPTFAQDPKTNFTQGKIGATVIPGVDEVYNPITTRFSTVAMAGPGCSPA
jgi:multiple sugar transport system substrate-binding protein